MDVLDIRCTPPILMDVESYIIIWFYFLEHLLDQWEGKREYMHTIPFFRCTLSMSLLNASCPVRDARHKAATPADDVISCHVTP